MKEMTAQDLEIRTNQILDELPTGAYKDNYQPIYPSEEALAEAILELQSTQPVTTINEIDNVKQMLQSGLPVIILGNCAEPVDLKTPIDRFVTSSLINIQTVAASALHQCILIERSRGQNTKPRTNETEIIGGTELFSYMGDAVNGREAYRRTPDPSRMVAAAVQARDIERGIKQEIGRHLPAAHEALLVAYEKSFISTDSETKKSYLLSGDLLWAGLRTNNPDGLHVEMLSKVVNPVGVKLGPDTTRDKVLKLTDKLNPDREPGKLVYMLRFGPDNPDSLTTTIEAIHDHDPNGCVIYDIHGSTRTVENGIKLRVVEEIVDEICVVSAICESTNMKLRGLHLETMTDHTQLQCVDTADQRPTHPGNVDPQLNPRQTLAVLNASAPYLL